MLAGPLGGTILSLVIKVYAPVISHHQLLITKSLTDSDLKWSHE